MSEDPGPGPGPSPGPGPGPIIKMSLAEDQPIPVERMITIASGDATKSEIKIAKIMAMMPNSVSNDLNPTRTRTRTIKIRAAVPKGV